MPKEENMDNFEWSLNFIILNFMYFNIMAVAREKNKKNSTEKQNFLTVFGCKQWINAKNRKIYIHQATSF